MKWQVVYQYAGQGQKSGYLIATFVAMLLILIGAIGALSKKSHSFLPFRLTGISPYGFIVFSISIFVVINWSQYKKNIIINDSKNNKCTIYEGKIEEIFPRSGRGEMGFKTQLRTFRYDAHHFALHEQLCDRGGLPVCMGDLARVCLHSDKDGEILKIEKQIVITQWAKKLGNRPAKTVW
jgi:hypothetical protein